MVIKLFGLVEANGEPMDLAVYTHTLMEIFRMKAEIDKEKADKEFMKAFGDFSIWDLMKAEMRDETGYKDEDGTGDPQGPSVSEQKGNADGTDRMGPASE